MCVGTYPITVASTKLIAGTRLVIAFAIVEEDKCRPSK